MTEHRSQGKPILYAPGLRRSLAGLAILTGLYLISLQNYLLFHTLVELFSVVISITIFVLVWNSRSFIDNRYLMVLGIAFFFIGGAGPAAHPGV